ncbi:MAG: hypothetical protein HY848_00090 [Betaproteobacteria bacterium]|nr:hypothetical protein [Betaproteobacteria bacterium]
MSAELGQDGKLTYQCGFCLERRDKDHILRCANISCGAFLCTTCYEKVTGHAYWSSSKNDCPGCNSVSMVLLGGGCVIVTALAAAAEDTEGALDIQLFRDWRDKVLLRNLGTREIVVDYYARAPILEMQLRSHPLYREISATCLRTYLREIARMIRAGNTDAALYTGQQMLAFLDGVTRGNARSTSHTEQALSNHLVQPTREKPRAAD